MKKFLSEKDYQHYIIDYLARENGYIKRTNGDIDRLFALDRELLFRFLKTTQGDALAELKRVFKKDLEKTIVGAINTAVISSSLFETLRHGVEINHTHLTLLYTKPETSFNEELVKKYKSNILSIAEEVWANDKEWVDLVVCLNGFAIITMELKCNAAGQSYEDAIRQFRLERDPKSRLFLFKAGAIVHFALDLQECHMTTKLSREATFFLPFNKGVGKGINSGKGNPINKDGFGVSYLWGDVLKKDALVEILTKFIFVERKSQDGANGKTKKSVNIIFPRFHQLDCIRRVVGDVRESRCAQNFLIQHSAGSGKTYTIAWLAHRLATLHDKLDKVVFDNVIIVTDRIVVDRQLQRAVRAIDHKPGMIAVIDDGKSSDDLRRALEGNTKIIATTIQKFRYIVENTRGLEKKTFAVIIDEAHSSTAGKNMGAVTGTLGSGKEETEEDLTEALSKDIAKKGKQSNVVFLPLLQLQRRQRSICLEG